MTSKLKYYILRKIIETAKASSNIETSSIKHLITLDNGKTDKRINLTLPVEVLENILGVTNVHKLSKIEPDDIIRQIEITNNRSNRKISFVIDRNLFVKEVIENCTAPDVTAAPKTIVVEYSSPNVAKPFHVGHLRSTIIGNFISNLSSYLHNRVLRLNYLGDWGTQFGLIKVGVSELKLGNDAIRKDPIKCLYESYVYANKLAASDDTVTERARHEFSKLENGSSDDLKDWHKYMKYTKDELIATYKRLGVTFDEYSYESMYNAKAISTLIDKWKERNVIFKDEDGKQVALLGDRRKVTLIKSDGTTLYLTRDIAAAIDRFEKYKFDKMYYIVENGQNDHFNCLKAMLYKMDSPWADRLKHIKFGRIHGMSTRKGNVVFLKDILDESRDLMVQRQIESPTTKVPITDGETSDVLAVSCVLINDLKQRRQRDYKFDWDKILQAQGDTGIKLQYTHCRLSSLERNTGVTPALTCVPELLSEDEATNLVRHLARFPDVLNNAEEQLEACILVNYLFYLCNYVNKAMLTLRVKGAESDVASQRLLLFSTSKDVLRTGMSILGLTPLQEM